MRRSRFALSVIIGAIVMGCGEDSFEPAAPPVSRVDEGVAKEDIIPDQYIVVFRDDVGHPVRLANELAATHGLQVRHTYSYALQGFSAVVPEAALAALERHPLVESVKPNRRYYIDTHPRAMGRSVPSLALAPLATAPANLNASSVSSTEIDLVWDDMSNDETGFDVERAMGTSGAFAKVGSVKSNVTGYSDGGLEPNTEYCYRVVAVSGRGKNQQYSAPSNISCATTLDGAPPTDNRPSDLTATAVTSSEIDLAWADNWGAQTGFQIQRCETSSVGSGCLDFADLVEVGAEVTSYGDLGVSPGYEYCYQVRAFKKKGRRFEYTEYSNVACDAPESQLPPSPPDAPSDLAASTASFEAIDLSWQDNSNSEDGFGVERCAGSGCSNFVEITQVGAGVTSYYDSGLTESTTYRYRVYAFNTNGNSGYSNEAQGTTSAAPSPPDGAPTNLSASPASASAIDLVWTDNSSNEDGFRIERHAGDGNFGMVATAGADATAYQDGGLDPSTTYTYRVVGFNAVGDSDYSNEASATTNDAPPPSACNDTGNHDDVSPLWNIERIRAHLNPKWQATQQAGCEMKAWFFGLDSGVDSDHPDLNVVETVDFVGDGSFGEDGNGHGTHTAGIAVAVDGNGNAVGVAPGAPIYAFKVCDDAGSCAEDDILSGIDEVTARKQANPSQPMVANMSLGGIGTDVVMETAVRRSVNAGVVYSLSAGNGLIGACLIPWDSQDHTPSRVGDDDINASDGSDGDTKRVNGAITVTSSDQSDSDYDCNYGNPVTVAAPGVGVISTWLNGTYANLSGTSMAAPHGAGAAILYLQDHPNATPAEVEQAIIGLLAPWTTDDTPNAGGRLDVDKL